MGDGLLLLCLGLVQGDRVLGVCQGLLIVSGVDRKLLVFDPAWYCEQVLHFAEPTTLSKEEGHLQLFSVLYIILLGIQSCLVGLILLYQFHFPNRNISFTL